MQARVCVTKRQFPDIALAERVGTNQSGAVIGAQSFGNHLPARLCTWRV